MEEKNYEKKSFSDRIKDKIGYQKQVTITFPIKVFDKLSTFATENSCDCFWLAIDKALDKYFELKDKDLTTIMLMDRDEQLKKLILSLDERLTIIEKPQPVKKKRGFGKVEEDGE